MKQIEINGNYVCINEFDSSINDFLKSGIIEDIFSNLEEKIILVLGGDGTMLRAVKEHYEKKLPFLGINFGDKGFLLNSKEILQKKQKFTKRIYPLLEVEIKIGEIIKKSIAFNEIDIRAGEGQMTSLDINLSKKQTLNITGDGIIVSTPAGSTGYNSSLLGPIIPHTLPIFVITPKAPWNPKGQTPILIDDSEIVKVSNVGRRHLIEVYSDGKEVLKSQNGTELNIKIKKSLDSVTLLIGENYINTWDNKVLQEQGFKLK